MDYGAAQAAYYEHLANNYQHAAMVYALQYWMTIIMLVAALAYSTLCCKLAIKANRHTASAVYLLLALLGGLVFLLTAYPVNP